MKICFVAPRIHTNQHAMLDALDVEDYQVFFMALTQGHLQQLHKTIKPVIINKLSLPFFKAPQLQLTSYRQIKNELSNIKPNIVIIRDVASVFSLQTFLACKRLGIQAILYNQHTLEAPIKRHIKLFQLIKIVPHYRITPVRKTNMVHNSKTNSWYVPLPIPTQNDISTKNIHPGEPLKVLFIGKYTLSRKNHIQLIRVIHRLSKEIPIKLTLVGVGYLPSRPVIQEITQYINNNNLQEKVTLLHDVEFVEMAQIYKSHHLFVLPSVREPFSISPLEAMSFALPVIITDDNGAVGAITNGKNGYVMPANDEDFLYEKIKFIYKKNILSQLSVNALEDSRSLYNKEIFFLYFNKTLENLKFNSTSNK